MNRNIGIWLTKGFLAAKGHRVQLHRIRAALMRTYPIGLVERHTSAIVRRKYQVHGPLSLWHIDSNHKLIRCCKTM